MHEHSTFFADKFESLVLSKTKALSAAKQKTIHEVCALAHEEARHFIDNEPILVSVGNYGDTVSLFIRESGTLCTIGVEIATLLIAALTEVLAPYKASISSTTISNLTSN